MEFFLKHQYLQFFIIFFIVFNNTLTSQNLEEKIDNIVTPIYTTNEPGAVILIAKNGEPIYRKAFGQANLELNIQMQSNNVFEIGSITKQFTAVAILMLEEEGKLKLNDKLTKYIPDYPKQAESITIHHLLNHTSGIKNYTSMSSFIKEARKDVTPEELINRFKNEPMDFNPGEEYRYSNSGYILLGYIIEKVSGQTYEDFIEQRIFKPLGMVSSYYGSHKELIKNRASGYQKSQEGFINAAYLSMTLPYAAGSIMSTVDDLLIWQNAIAKNKLIKKTSLQKATNGSKLNNGKSIAYGYGWSKNTINGALTYQHGGGIFGYTSMGIYLPEEKVYVIGLTNCNCKNILEVVNKIAALAIGKPYPKAKDAITLTEAQLKKWTGTYEFENKKISHVILENGKLYSKTDGFPKYQIYPLSEDKFFYLNGGASLEFSIKEGKKQAIFKSINKNAVGIETDKVKTKKEIFVPTDILKQYVGKYQLAPNFIITVEVKDGKLFAQATGQPQFQIFAEDEDTFFFKVVEASMDFNKSDSGTVSSLTLHQSGQHIEAKRI